MILLNEKQEEKNMGIYEELQARGLIAQVTDEDQIGRASCRERV